MRMINAYSVRIDQMATGENIRKLLEQRGCSPRMLRDMLHLQCVQSIYHWFQGQIPSIDNLVCLSRILELPIEELLVIEDDTDLESVHPPVMQRKGQAESRG